MNNKQDKKQSLLHNYCAMGSVYFVVQPWIPDIFVDDKIQVIYKDVKKFDDGLKPDVVYAIYKESELE